MQPRPCAFILILSFAFAAAGDSLAQTRVRTEIIRPPAAPAPAQAGGAPDVVTDLARLPPPVARMRERILEAARSGNLEKVVTVMQSNETVPIFSFGNDKDPIALWRGNYPDSEGIELLSILIAVLEAPFMHVEQGTAQEMYVWPYFARISLKALTTEQKVGLFRIVTGADYKAMVEFGAYNFYRLGIGPDGVWHFFVAGN
jgi:hypothetical protein